MEHYHTSTHSPSSSSSANNTSGSGSASSKNGPVTDTELIGRAIDFETGQFARQTMRAELIEIQKADLGRKLSCRCRYARVDRRPLDPPPVVLLKLYHVINPGGPHEVEQEVASYEEIQGHGMISTVDLFPIPGPLGSGRDSPGSSGRSRSVSPPQTPYHGSVSNGNSASTSHSNSIVSSLPAYYQTDSSNDDTVVHHVNNFPVTESSKMTNCLVGGTFIQPNLVEYQGKKALVFVFADLAVKNEGHFILRYRVFDLYSRPKNRPEDRIIVQAECYGGPFRIYSTKEFPGLQASTELTKHLARWGVRLNIRETERRRRKKGESESPPYTTTAMKRKRHSSDSAAGDEGSDGE